MEITITNQETKETATLYMWAEGWIFAGDDQNNITTPAVLRSYAHAYGGWAYQAANEAWHERYPDASDALSRLAGVA